MAALPCIVTQSDARVLARARSPQDVIALEGNWYFHPDTVDRAVLERTERTYTCPYKGTCFWIDYKGAKGVVTDVAWVYPDPKPGFRRIAGWYGFYADHALYRYTECEEP